MDGPGNLLHMSALAAWEDGAWDVALSSVCGRVRFPPEWSSGEAWWRTLADHDLWVVWEGRGHMEIGDTPVALGPGSCVWMEPGRRYVTTHDPAHPLGVYFFHFTPLRTGKAPGRRLAPPLRHTVIRHFGFVDSLLQRVLALRGEPDGPASANRLFAALLQELVREARHGWRRPEGVSAEKVDRMNAAAARIRQNPAVVLTVEELARESGCSVSHFSRTFAAVLGERPQEFAIGVRLERARELLATTGLPVGEVAAAAGFADIFYFSRLFKRRAGVTPSEFRRQALASGG